MKQCDNTNEKEKTIMKLVNVSYSPNLENKIRHFLCVVPLPLTTDGSWSCDEKFALPSLAHEPLVTWLPTLCWYKKMTAGVEKKYGTFLIVPREFHDFQILRYVSQKKTSDTSMSTLARKEASQPWEQERVGVLGWRWKPISLEHTKTSATHKSSLYIFRGWLAMAHGWFRISWLPSVVCLSSQASVEFDFVQHEAPFDHWDG